MECDRGNNPLPTTPPPSSLRLINPDRRAGDTCYECGKMGHWAKDCSTKTSRKSLFSSPGSNLPLIRCPCNEGACRVSISTTLKNPNRKYYACPVDKSRGKCNFFKWCDEFDNVRIPSCPCDIGTCSLNRISSGPDEGRWYFACRIRKNFGQCDFFQWADPEINLMMKRQGGKSKGYSPRQLLFNTENAMHSDAAEVPNTNGDLVVMQEGDSCKPLERNAPQFCQPMAQSKSCLGNKLKHVSDAGDIVTEGTFPSFNPVMASEDADMSDVEGTFLLPNTALSAETEKSPCRTPGQDAEVSGGTLHEPVGVNDTSDVMQDDDVFSKLILMNLGESFLNALDSTNPLDLDQMLRVADGFFIFLQNLSIDCSPFVKAVKDYIHNRSKLASIDGFLSYRLSYKELSNIYDNEKVRNETISHLHSEAQAAHRASSNRCQSVQEEVSRTKEVLIEREKQLFYCRKEISEQVAQVDELSKKKFESRNNLEAIALDMAEVDELQRERESASNAANAALETAKIWLECSVIYLPDLDVC